MSSRLSPYSEVPLYVFLLVALGFLSLSVLSFSATAVFSEIALKTHSTLPAQHRTVDGHSRQ